MRTIVRDGFEGRGGGRSASARAGSALAPTPALALPPVLRFAAIVSGSVASPARRRDYATIAARPRSDRVHFAVYCAGSTASNHVPCLNACAIARTLCDTPR
jgi:hypothetical protein